MSELGDPFDDNNSARKHGVDLLGSIARIDEGRLEFADIWQLEGRVVEGHVPVEVGEDVRHVIQFELGEEEVEASLPFLMLRFLPFDEADLGDHQLQENVQKDTGEVGIRRTDAFTGLRRDEGTDLSWIDGSILKNRGVI